jgi:hypothetical protein
VVREEIRAPHRRLAAAVLPDELPYRVSQAGRRWAERAVLGGHLTVAELQGDLLDACTVQGGEDRLLVERRPAAPETTLTEARRAAVRDVALELSINAEGVLDLCTLGWLDPDKLQDPAAVGDAEAWLTNEAFVLRLRPSH